jgi:hypothetical protein
MVEGKALISFGFGTTLTLGGTGTYCDSPAVSLGFRSREPGPLTDAEKDSYTDRGISNRYE